jgi:hypothetical protein
MIADFLCFFNLMPHDGMGQNAPQKICPRPIERISFEKSDDGVLFEWMELSRGKLLDENGEDVSV